ncbi:SETD7, partial [Symbiodinium microadriaticum]
MPSQDLLELERVTVSQSRLKEDMEGLFAKGPLRAGELCSWYNGLRCSHEEVNERDWCLNGMTITLDNETVLDVPVQFASTDVFRACLGHKANHRKPNNAKYDVFDHPRFGLIKAIRAVRDIAAGEEICCDYGYEGEQE